MMNKSVIVGMSGGVDSSVAAALLKEQGCQVIGVTMKLWNGEQAEGGCCSLSAVHDARRVADKLGIPFYVMDFQREFNEFVISDFIRAYKAGKTPNPCIACNRYIKFDALLAKARAIGADYVATGHYAKIHRQNGRFLLCRPADRHKDQTYFLYSMTQQQLAHTLMPLHGVTKEQTRAIAEELGLAVAKKPDSQEICFVPDGNYARFIEDADGAAPAGDFVDASGAVLGSHKGLLHYTIGQRKGLGVSFGRPMYVTKIDAVLNRVTLGEEGSQYASSLLADDLNFIPFDTLDKPLQVHAKVRYQARPAEAVLTPVEHGRVRVDFAEAQRSITPGQAVVFYDGDLVVGGGTIV